MDRKVVVHLYGGIGNQLFQYTFGEYIRNKYHESVSYDISSFGVLETFRNLQINVIAKEIPVFKTNKYFFSRHTRIYRRISRWFFCRKPGVRYFDNTVDEIVFSDDSWDLIYFDGYWQEKKYAEWIVTFNPNFFMPAISIPPRIETIASQLKGMNATSIHIRRGDYLLPVNAHLNVCNELYYLKAAQILSNENESVLVVFSDDIKWVSENLRFHNKTIYIEDKGESPFWYIYLMSLCNNHIISNSTFSWWGAFLDRNNNKKIVAPSRWRNDGPNPDLYYNEWSLLEV